MCMHLLAHACVCVCVYACVCVQMCVYIFSSVSVCICVCRGVGGGGYSVCLEGCTQEIERKRERERMFSFTCDLEALLQPTCVCPLLDVHPPKLCAAIENWQCCMLCLDVVLLQ